MYSSGSQTGASFEISWGVAQPFCSKLLSNKQRTVSFTVM